MSEITGPAIGIDEGQRILQLMREPNWQFFQDVLTGIEKNAARSLRRVGQSEERNGYWKGVLQIIEDITVNIPNGIALQLTAERELKNKNTETTAHTEWV